MPVFWIVSLLAVPLAAAGAALVPGTERMRTVSARAFAGVIACLSVGLFWDSFHQNVQYFHAHISWVEEVLPWLEGALGAYFVFIGLRNRRAGIVLMAVVQTALLAWVEFSPAKAVHVEHNLFIDKLSILMALVIGVVGGLICLYAPGYITRYHAHHHAVPDRSRGFLALLFVFLSAMFGVVFSNNLSWLYFSWEVTTLCSFLLIGYTQTDEARNNALRALQYNMLGGVAFAAGIAYLARCNGLLELDRMMGADKAAVLLPAVLLSFAGLTKSAQLPFSQWLLGAMVAPTPVSALLHSSTMVKAGVYLILRFASVLHATSAGFMLALVGAVTFLVGSCIAISESDAKRILAYSTVANLGLIVLCAGVGTPEALWAAVLLIVFHAISKCLLFLCVGVVDHHLHSRDVESMSGLVVTMPGVSVMMQIGMAGMFLAPFGMLISKWAVLKALVDYNPLLAVFVIFGSAATLVYWVKWCGKLLMVTGGERRTDSDIDRAQWTALGALSVMTVAVCALFPVLSTVLIEPYVVEIYGRGVTMSQGNIVIMSIMLAMVMLFPLAFLRYGRNVKVVDAYLAGANTGNGAQFTGAAQSVRDMQMGNYYLGAYFGEKRLFKPGVVVSVFLTVLMFVLSIR